MQPSDILPVEPARDVTGSILECPPKELAVERLRLLDVGGPRLTQQNVPSG